MTAPCGKAMDWMIWTLRMPWHYCHTAINECKKKTFLVTVIAMEIVFNINKNKSKILKNNSISTNVLTIKKASWKNYSQGKKEEVSPKKHIWKLKSPRCVLIGTR